MTAPSDRTQDTRRQLIAVIRAHVHHDREGADALGDFETIDDLAVLAREAVGLVTFLLSHYPPDHVDRAIDALGRDLLAAPEPPHLSGGDDDQ